MMSSTPAADEETCAPALTGGGAEPACGYAPAPQPPSERRAWAIAGGLAASGLIVLVAVLAGFVGRSPVQPPPLVLVAPTPSAGAQVQAPAAADAHAAILARPSTVQQRQDSRRFAAATETHIERSWMEGFYPIYAVAQRTFGVNWLLIASIHMQETAFSTAPSTYRGLNFAHCCGGPMQFNVTNGSVSTWDLVSDSYTHGHRPASYGHMMATHPSIYDDFDAIMAGAHLLSADGAGYALDYSAWAAAYDYYGHDATGVTYADEVLARAIGWSQHGFCINCGVDAATEEAVHAAYGAPVLGALTPPSAHAPAKDVARAARSKGGR